MGEIVGRGERRIRKRGEEREERERRRERGKKERRERVCVERVGEGEERDHVGKDRE